MEKNDLLLGEALAYEDYLPVSCRLSGGVIKPAQRLALNVANEEVLQNVLLLEKHHSEALNEESSVINSEIAHIDFKVNLLLDVMLQVFSAQLKIPSDVAMSMTSTRLQCTIEQSFQVGDTLMVDLFLHRRFPRPLTLFGRIAHRETEKDSSASIIMEFEYINASVQGLLERFIFLKHRRRVASVRREQQKVTLQV